MLVRNQLGERCINVKHLKEIRVYSSHPSKAYIEAIEPGDVPKVAILGIYHSREKAKEELEKVVELSNQKDMDGFIYTLPMDEFIDMADVIFVLRDDER